MRDKELCVCVFLNRALPSETFLNSELIASSSFSLDLFLHAGIILCPADMDIA